MPIDKINAARRTQELLGLMVAAAIPAWTKVYQLPLLLALNLHHGALLFVVLQAEDADPRAFGFLDLVALVMMQSGGTDRSLLQKKVAAAKHSLLHGKPDLREALKNCTSKLDIDM